jgi:hypothetical protein
VHFLELGFMDSEGSFFFTREWTYSPSDHRYEGRRRSGGGGDLMTKTVIKHVHWKGIKAPELGL